MEPIFLPLLVPISTGSTQAGAPNSSIPADLWYKTGQKQRLLSKLQEETSTITVSSSDKRDIAESLKGNEDAFARLVARYQNRVSAQMWRFTRDPRCLEELVQETFVQVYYSLRSYKHKAPFEHWLSRIATRVGYRHWKQQTRRRQELPLDDFQFEAQQPPEPSHAAELLYTLLEQLPPKDRLVLTLMYFEQLSIKEISGRTGWSASLVKVQAHRARKKLKKLLEQAGIKGIHHV